MNWSTCQFVGEHHLSHVTNAFSSALLDWSHHWGNGVVGQPPVLCERARTPDPEGAEYDGEWMALRSQGSPIAWVQLHRGQSAEILEYFSLPSKASASEPASEFAEELGHKLLLDLFARLIRSSSLEMEGLHFEFDVYIPPTKKSRWSGMVLVPCSFGKIELKCLIPYESVQRIVPGMPQRQQRALQLVRLSEAIRNSTVSIDVRLRALDGLTLGNLDELVEGSVVIFDCAPDASWTAYGPGDRSLAQCKLGRANNRFAVHWAASKNSREKL
jgi:hypothetical protein